MVATEPNLKKFIEGNTRNLAFIFSRDVTKIRTTHVVSSVGIQFAASTEVILFLLRVACVIFECAINSGVWQAMVARTIESQ